MQVDYIIVGQGLCGSFLAHYLLQQHKTVLVIDNAKPNAASKISSGVINPVTGRRFVCTWMIEGVMPFAVQAYTAFEQQCGTNLIEQKNVIDFFASPQMQLAFEERVREGENYLELYSSPQLLYTHFNFSFGVGQIQPCYLVNVIEFLQQTKTQLENSSSLIRENFELNELQLLQDAIKYKGITAHKIIFCDGVEGATNPYFNLLPFAPNKGQALIVRIKNLPKNFIFKQGLTIVPWKDDLFWIGSNYEWQFTHENPTEEFRSKTLQQLQYWIKQPFELIEHWAGIRPANLERRPFVGLHPHHPQIGILNGMGTKGCSLAPYFAYELTQHLLYQKPIEPLADVKRFSKILGRAKQL